MDEYALRRLEREARARHTGTSRVGIPSRSTVCELCGQADVKWGSMCQDCRARLLGGDPTPLSHGPANKAVTATQRRPVRTPRRRRRGGGIINPTEAVGEAGFRSLAQSGHGGLSLIQNLPGAVYRCLADGPRTVMFVTHQIRAVTGHDPSAFRPGLNNLTSIIHPEDSERVRAELSSVVDGMPFESDYRIQHVSEGVRWVHDRAVVVVDDQGRRFMDGVLMDITERRAAQDEIAWLALHDPLTGLPNRRAFDERLSVLTSDPRQLHLSAVVFDIDHFKAINDHNGHDVGDRALVEVARRLRDVVGNSGMLARVGGEEFVALLPNHSLAQAVVVAEIARKAVEGAPIEGLAITVSAGVASNAYGRDIVTNADHALYQAKREGRNRVAGFPG